MILCVCVYVFVCVFVRMEIEYMAAAYLLHVQGCLQSMGMFEHCIYGTL